MTNDAGEDPLVLHIYDVITDSERWTGVLDGVCAYMGAVSATLVYSDLVHYELDSIWTNSTAAAFLAEQSNYQLLSAGLELYRDIPRYITERGWLCEEECWRRYPGREHNDFYASLNGRVREYYSSGLKYVLSPLNFRPNYFDHIALHYPEHAYPPAPERLARGNMLLTHLARAIELSRPFLLLKKSFRAVFDVLDLLQLGVVLFDEDLKVWLRNESAARILERGDCIKVKENGVLEVTHNPAQKRFRRAVDEIVRYGGSGPRSRRLALPRVEGCEPYIADLSVIGCTRDFSGSAKQGLVMFLVDPDRTDIVDFSHLQELFDLTPRETEVGGLVARGYSVPDMSDILNVSPNTLGTHMRSLYTKTGVHRRAELMHLAHNVNIPISRDPGDD